MEHSGDMSCLSCIPGRRGDALRFPDLDPLHRLKWRAAFARAARPITRTAFRPRHRGPRADPAPARAPRPLRTLGPVPLAPLHRLVGWLTLAAFIASGIYLRVSLPAPD